MKTVTTKNRKRFGDVLVEAGVISAEALEEALGEQAQTQLKLGEVLIQRGIVTERQIVDILSRHLRVRRLNIDKFTPHPELAEVLSEEEALRLHAAPLLKKGSLLIITCTDPTDISMTDELQSATHLEIESVICTRSELREVFKAVYGRDFQAADDKLIDLEAIDETEIEQEEDEPDETINISNLQSMVEEAPVIKLVNSILVKALNAGASDIHLRAVRNNVLLQLRIDGKLKRFDSFPKQYFFPLVSRLKLLSNLDISVTRVPQDGRFSYRVANKEIGVRTSTLPTIYGEKVVMRLHVQDKKHFTLGDLGLGEREQTLVRRAAKKPFGMILTTGPTGSGKTTLLYTLLDMVNDSGINIVTLEDPVESRVDYMTQIQLNTKVGMTFASGLRSILRQDPDVIMVGEIRDGETAHIAIESAMTGHKVLSTLHTNDASGAVSRFLEMGLEPFLIASTMLIVIAQRLVRKICPHCIEPYQASKKELRAMSLDPSQSPIMHFFKGRGCPSCGNTGYKGRMGVFEVLNIDDKVQQLIIQRASAQEIRNVAIADGSLRPLRTDAAHKVLQGLTTFEEYLSVAI